jgi:hypothetical protein
MVVCKRSENLIRDEDALRLYNPIVTVEVSLVAQRLTTACGGRIQRWQWCADSGCPVCSGLMILVGQIRGFRKIQRVLVASDLRRRLPFMAGAWRRGGDQSTLATLACVVERRNEPIVSIGLSFLACHQLPR